MNTTRQEWEDEIAYTAHAIATEIASEHGLWLHEPADALKVWPDIAAHARRQTRLARAQLAATTPDTTT